jgi:penicillin-binding protein 1C
MKRAFAISLAGLLAAALFVFIASWLLVDPHLERSETYPGGVVLRDDAGRILRVSLGADDVDCRPDYVPSTNDWIVQALVASEDRRFFRHCGVDALCVLRACVQNATSLRRVSGASTITMQAARLIAPHPRTLAWKYVEAFRAMQIESRHDKLWIVGQYLNRVPFGSNLVGIEAAANGWFGKRARDLGIGEAALLAGMVQSPTRFRPDRHLAAALKRRDYVLSRMRACGMIDAAQEEGARSSVPEIRRGPRPFDEPFFCDWAMRHVERRGAASGDFRTTLDADVQAQARSVVAAAARGGRSAAAVVMRVETGAVVALACSGDYFSSDAGQVNVATSPRPAGSTLKPFLTARALDRGFVTPEERLPDVPRAYKGYNPQNFDATHRGLVTAADALVLSLNLPFVHLISRTGVEDFGATLRALGFGNMGEADASYGLGMAIGNVQVSLVELVNAYACLARGGVARPPCALADEVAEQKGRPGLLVFSEGASRLVTEMLAGEERSASALGHVADVRASRFAWKTGTSAAYRDAWTVLWNPEFAVGVWTGHKSGGFGDTDVVGAQAAAPFAWSLARSLYPAENGPWYGAMPAEVVERTICAESGLPAGADCPSTEVGRALRGRSSCALCPVHVRGADGAVARCGDAFVAAYRGEARKATKLAFRRPTDGAVYRLLPGVANQKVVCHVVGNVEDGRLWWFVDGRPRGETRGTAAFAWEPETGAHRISCSTADGVSASVSIRVERE